MERLQPYLAAAIIIGLCIWGFYLLLPDYTDYAKAQRSLGAVEQSLAAHRSERESLAREIDALKHEPQAVERVAREKFGWCRANEQVYRFTVLHPVELRRSATDAAE
jgi:cell division protein FtsB